MQLAEEAAALRISAAVQHYAATHNGLPPARLEDITDLPLPLDPLTGKPFGYEVKGHDVVLLSGAPRPPPSPGSISATTSPFCPTPSPRRSEPCLACH